MRAQRVDAYIQEVANVPTLLAALGNVNVTQIHLMADLLLMDAGTRIDGIVLNRNVHIRGVGCSGEATLVGRIALISPPSTPAVPHTKSSSPHQLPRGCSLAHARCITNRLSTASH